MGICAKSSLLYFLDIFSTPPFPNKSIIFPAQFPKELDILSNIDYDEQFDKSFVQPLKFITEKMNWLIDSSYGQQGTLEDFFN